MLVKYVGGRSWLRVTFNRENYNFTKENDRILDIKDQRILNHIFSLPNSSEFEIVMNEPELISKDGKIPEELELEKKSDNKKVKLEKKYKKKEK